jgi:2-dehydro-3-deoxy-D-gluconate 5-dehydrogenase
VSAEETAGELFSLRARTALVTGAGRGIGRALALGLARAGADLVLVGRPGTQDGTRVEVEAIGRSAEVLDLDLADIDAVRSSGHTLAREVHVDVLVNNAGTIERCDALDVDPASWARVLDVNLSGLFFLTQQLARPMLARGSGKIINIASLLSFQGGVRVAPYAASKHAVAGLTRALANEWAPHGVQVNAIAPGYIATDNTRALREDRERSQAISDRIPAGRWGEPDDLLGAAVFLASRASDYVNGHVLVVDGGWSAR